MIENNNNESESSEKQAEDRKEYRKLVIELYKENQKFLNNLILGISILAFPFLYNVLSNGELAKTTQWLLSIALFGFCFVILLQIIALKSAKQGCDKSLSKNEETKKQAIKLFERARELDKYRDCFFLASVILTTVGTLNIF